MIVGFLEFRFVYSKHGFVLLPFFFGLLYLFLLFSIDIYSQGPVVRTLFYKIVPINSVIFISIRVLKKIYT